MGRLPFGGGEERAAVVHFVDVPDARGHEYALGEHRRGKNKPFLPWDSSLAPGNPTEVTRLIQTHFERLRSGSHGKSNHIGLRGFVRDLVRNGIVGICPFRSSRITNMESPLGEL